MKYINCILLLLLFTMLISCSKEPTCYSHTKVFVPSVKSYYLNKIVWRIAVILLYLHHYNKPITRWT